MRLHLLGLPHTRTTDAFSHCAYTAKIRKFIPMMAAQGYAITHYGSGMPDVMGADHVEVMPQRVQVELLGYDPLDPGEATKFVGRSTDVTSPLYRKFNSRLRSILHGCSLAPDDIICLPFGHGHEQAVQDFMPLTVETGIGYPTCISGYRIYESYAWMHWHLGRDQRQAWVSEWVVPNYFDPGDWPQRPERPRANQYALYFGRITKEKGMDVVWNLARARRDLTFVLCGQGDPAPWLTEPNIVYERPRTGCDRAALFHGARVVLLPTVYVEPFGGVAIEAMMTGTPIITADSGAFTETNPCATCRPHTEAEWLHALEMALGKDPAALRNYALSRYSVQMVGPKYRKIFEIIPKMRHHGWSAGVHDG